MAGSPERINSPFGNKPRTLPNPVPTEGVEQDLAQATSKAAQVVANPGPGRPPGEAPEPATVSPAEATGAVAPTDPQSLEDFFAESTPLPQEPGMEGEEAPQDAMDLMPGEDEFGEEPGFVKAQINQFKDMGTRFQYGLSATDQQVFDLVKQNRGPENVAWKDNKIWLRNNPKEKFRPLDADHIELFSDLIPDAARGVVQEISALPNEVAGFFIAGPVGAYLGRVTSGPQQVAAADWVAKKAGVPDDPSRNVAVEMGVTSALEATLPVVGKFAKRFIPGTQAFKTAMSKGKNKLTSLGQQSVAVNKAAQELAEVGKAVQINGEFLGVPGGTGTLAAHQMNPESPYLQRLKESASEFQPFVNAMRQHAEDWGVLFRETMTEIGTRSGKVQQVTPDKLASAVQNMAKSVREAEGQAIGRYTRKAATKLNKGDVALNEEVLGQLSNMVQATGFTPKGKPATTPEIRQLLGKFGITSTGEARAITNGLNDIAEGLTQSGGLKLNDLNRFRNTIYDLGERMDGTPAGRELMKLSGALRKNYREVVTKGLDDDFERKAFNEAMDEYGVISDNMHTLRRTMNSDMSANAIVSRYFTGKDNVSMLKSIKALSPESFDQLRGEWVSQQLTQFSSRETASGVNAGKFLDTMEKKWGKEFLDEVFPGAEQKTLKNLGTVIERLDKQFSEGKIDTASESLKQGSMNTLLGLFADVKFKWVNGLAAMFAGQGSGPEHAAIQLLSRDGIDKYVANFPGKPGLDKGMLAQKLKDFTTQYRIERTVQNTKRNISKIIQAPGQAIDSAAGRAAVRIPLREELTPE